MGKIKDLRAAVKSLEGCNFKPKDGRWYGGIPKLRNGTIWVGYNAIHPVTFLNIVGAKAFRKIDADCSDERVIAFIKEHRKSLNDRRREKL